MTVQAYLTSTSGAEMMRLPTSERTAKGAEDIPHCQILGRFSFQSIKPLWYSVRIMQHRGKEMLPKDSEKYKF